MAFSSPERCLRFWPAASSSICTKQLTWYVHKTKANQGPQPLEPAACRRGASRLDTSDRSENEEFSSSWKWLNLPSTSSRSTRMCLLAGYPILSYFDEKNMNIGSITTEVVTHPSLPCCFFEKSMTRAVWDLQRSLAPLPTIGKQQTRQAIETNKRPVKEKKLRKAEI